jgi:hypothetical protein
MRVSGDTAAGNPHGFVPVFRDVWGMNGARDTSSPAILRAALEHVIVGDSDVYAVVDDALSPDFPLGDSLEVFIRREDAEGFVEEVRGDEPELAAKLRIEERELETGGLN